MNSAPIIAESNRGSFAGLDEPGPRITDGSVAPGDLSVPLIVQSAGPTSAQQPVTVGVPFPRGVLRDDVSLSLLDSLGKPVPLQLNPLARWSDGSVKWMLLDFILGPVVAGQSVWSTEVRHGEPKEVGRPGQPLRVAETDRAILVETGSATFTLDRQILAPLAQVEIDEHADPGCGNKRTVLVDAKGRNCLLRSSGLKSKRTVPCGPRCCLKGLSRVVVVTAAVFLLGSPSSPACPWSEDRLHRP